MARVFYKGGMIDVQNIRFDTYFIGIPSRIYTEYILTDFKNSPVLGI